jgi:hypothetical protein
MGNLDNPRFDQDENEFICAQPLDENSPLALVGKVAGGGKITGEAVNAGPGPNPPGTSTLFECTNL